MQKSPDLKLNGTSVSRETQQRLEHFAELFIKWSKSINLVAPSTMSTMWTRHIADSAQIFSLSPHPHQWIDLGSGGGFPGIITAILLREIEGGWVHLVESNHKKAAFLRVALQETGGRGTVHPVRIEDAPPLVPNCQAISARALADLNSLLTYVEPWVINQKARCYFHKGRDYLTEIDKARGCWDFDLIHHASAVESDSNILEVFNIGRKP
jgi:16S rRNA (guanine527-N7)-methyltransferase